MRLRNTARRGRRRWLAWPTWRAIAIVSLVLGLWVASGSFWIAIGNGDNLDVRFGRGGLWISRGAVRWWVTPARGLETGSDWGKLYNLDLRFKIYRGDYGPTRGSVVYVSLLIIVVPLVGAILLWSMWRRQPFPTGHCAFCGYDLRGTTRGRCPECGTATSPPPPYSETR